MYKKIINTIFKITDAFNKEWNANIERKVMEATKAHLVNEDIPLDDSENKVKQMREHYHLRISSSSNLLIALSTFLISATALIVAIIALANTD
jgi:hypothetical protein